MNGTTVFEPDSVPSVNMAKCAGEGLCKTFWSCDLVFCEINFFFFFFDIKVVQNYLQILSLHVTFFMC